MNLFPNTHSHTFSDMLFHHLANYLLRMFQASNLFIRLPKVTPDNQTFLHLIMRLKKTASRDEEAE